jgi:hypothetical protein
MNNEQPRTRRAWLVAIVATLAMTVSYVDRQVVAAIGSDLRGVVVSALHALAPSFAIGARSGAKRRSLWSSRAGGGFLRIVPLATRMGCFIFKTDQ